MAAEWIGALSFSYYQAQGLAEKVQEYYDAFTAAVPLTPAMNPNFLAVSAICHSWSHAPTTRPIRRIGIKGGFFSLALQRHYAKGDYVPGHCDFWAEYEESLKEDSSRVYGPGRGAVGSPETVREFLHAYEESGVDEIMFFTAVENHEATMEAIELMGKYIIPEIREHDEAAAERKRRRMEPILERAEARRVDDRPPVDLNYRIGGAPRSLKTDYVAMEAVLNAQEMSENIAEARLAADTFTGR